MRRASLIFLAVPGLLALLFWPAEAESLAQVNYEDFLRMDPSDKVGYTKGVIDGVVAAGAMRMIPRETVADFMNCPVKVSYGEVISFAESYMWKTAASSERESAKSLPAAVWIAKSYRVKCGAKE